jgi:hypothetical protein
VQQRSDALRGQTPRDAVRRKAGRERVGFILKEMENHDARVADGVRFDFGRLRAELVLEDR